MEELLNFWFGSDLTFINSKLWFGADQTQDLLIREKFLTLHQRLYQDEYEQLAWQATHKGKLALIILFDQLSRNMFRGSSDMFKYDHIAQQLGLNLVNDPATLQLLSPLENVFVNLALQHSENPDHVRTALKFLNLVKLEVRDEQLAKKFGRFIKATKSHLEILKKFGRYPHRNALLGRESTEQELYFLKTCKHSFVKSVGYQTGDDSARKVREKPAKTVKNAQFRMRVVCFHSFRQNAHKLRRSFEKIMRLTHPFCDFYFAEAPLPYKAQGEELRALLATFAQVPETKYQRCWWHATADNKTYQHLDFSLDYLNRFWQQYGPFDGVIGFSQGGALAGILSALQPYQSIAFKFCVLISAFRSRADAHQELLVKDAIKIPSLHIYGETDELVDNVRSLDLANCFKDAQVVSHPGGHFSPTRWPTQAIADFLSKQLEISTMATPTLTALNTGNLEECLLATVNQVVSQSYGKRKEILSEKLWVKPLGLSSDIEMSFNQLDTHLLTEVSPIVQVSIDQIIKALQQESSLIQLKDAVLLIFSLREGFFYGVEPPNSLFFKRIMDLYTASPSLTEKQVIPLIPKFGSWKDLNQIAVINTFPSLHSLLVKMYVDQLKIDELALDQTSGKISKCARDAPRFRSYTDKQCRLAKDIANVLAFGDIAMEELNDGQKVRRNKRYTELLSRLNKAQNSFEQRRIKKALGKTQDTLPEKLSEYVLRPEPEPLSIVPLQDLDPLLDWMRMDLSLSGPQQAFKAGIVTSDGRLDLCKQVVGPSGIHPLLSAMKQCSAVKRLLLGNNYVGNGGAEGIAEYIRDPNSNIDIWYIAGNEFDADGIKLVTDALENDVKVTGLWLKRNPLRPAGMKHVAKLMSINRKINTLDVLNCGILDEGVAYLIPALKQNNVLEHLYLDTNGLGLESAALLGDFLASGQSNLISLYLSCNRFGDEGAIKLAAGLAKDTRLRRLGLSSNGIGPVGLKALVEALIARGSEMESLTLGFMRGTNLLGGISNRVGDEGAKEIARLLLHPGLNLRLLDLAHNNISATGIRLIRQAMETLADDNTLVVLRLIQYGLAQNEVTKEWINARLDKTARLWAERLLIEKPERDLQQLQLPDGWNDLSVDALVEQVIKRIELPKHVADIMSVYRTK